jgi:hypothetical protein
VRRYPCRRDSHTSTGSQLGTARRPAHESRPGEDVVLPPLAKRASGYGQVIFGRYADSHVIVSGSMSNATSGRLMETRGGQARWQALRALRPIAVAVAFSSSR